VFSGGASLEAAERVCAGDAVGAWEVLDLLTALTEKSLLVAEGDSAPRYRMLGTIKEYAEHRLAEAGEPDLARQAHLTYFTELAETAEPRLRRAEQLEWLATLGAEHDNIGAAMRGALAAGDAHAAMRLAAGAGWYWWLSGHKSEGMELITAAAGLPGEVPDETRGVVYGLISMFVTSGPSDEQQAAEWIHKAYEISTRVLGGHPALRLVGPLERMLRTPDVNAFEPLLADDDPWVRALARLHLGKMRIVLGQGGQEADAHLETALAEFRALGERFGISFALFELADRLTSRGEFAAACELYDQAISVVTEIGAVDDVIRLRSGQAAVYWLLGDEEASAAAMAEAGRRAERVTWPGTLSQLALSRAELARMRGEAEQANIRAVTHDLLGYLADDLDEARAHRAAACAAAAGAGHPLTIARVLVGVADLALRRDQYEQAARLLAASAGVRGLVDRSQPDIARIERTARSRLGDTRYAEAAREGTGTSWDRLVAVTLAS
jgi:hypothetical protein